MFCRFMKLEICVSGRFCLHLDLENCARKLKSSEHHPAPQQVQNVLKIVFTSNILIPWYVLSCKQKLCARKAVRLSVRQLAGKEVKTL